MTCIESGVCPGGCRPTPTVGLASKMEDVRRAGGPEASTVPFIIPTDHGPIRPILHGFWTCRRFQALAIFLISFHFKNKAKQKKAKGTDLERYDPAQGSHGEDEHCGEHQVEEEAAQEAVGRRAPCSHESAQPVAATTTITGRHDTPTPKAASTTSANQLATSKSRWIDEATGSEEEQPRPRRIGE